MVSRCETCRYWTRQQPGELRTDPPRTDGAGYCVRMYQGCKETRRPRFEAPFDGGYAEAEVLFITPPDFGCTLHEEKAR